MTHRTFPRFWILYTALPEDIQRLADKNYELLKGNPHHPSLHFKKIGKRNKTWSVRVGDSYRALAIEPESGIIVWFWIGPHAEYDKLISQL